MEQFKCPGIHSSYMYSDGVFGQMFNLCKGDRKVNWKNQCDPGQKRMLKRRKTARDINKMARQNEE